MEKVYFDTESTPVTQKPVYKESATAIISTDARVKSWFAPLPSGHRRAYDDNGLPFNELIPPPTQSDIDKQLINEKWDSLREYLSTLTITTIAGNKFDVSPIGLSNITQRVNTMTDTDTDTWYEDWASFAVNKVELQEALVKQAAAKKAKIAELFGAAQ